MNPIKACTAVCALLASCANVTQDTCNPLDIPIEYSQELSFKVDSYPYTVILQYEDTVDRLPSGDIVRLYEAFLSHWKEQGRPNYKDVLEYLSDGYIYVFHANIGEQSDIADIFWDNGDVAIAFTWDYIDCRLPEYKEVGYQIFARIDDVYYSLAHEFTHRALYAAYGDADGNHTRKDYWKKHGQEGNFLGTLTSEVDGFPVLNQEPP